MPLFLLMHTKEYYSTGTIGTEMCLAFCSAYSIIVLDFICVKCFKADKTQPLRCRSLSKLGIFSGFIILYKISVCSAKCSSVSFGSPILWYCFPAWKWDSNITTPEPPLFIQSSLLLTGYLCSFWSLISGFTSFLTVWRGHKRFSWHRQSQQMCEGQTLGHWRGMPALLPCLSEP